MAKENPNKIRKHAPYRKSFLIPLWVLQLSSSLTLLILFAMSVGYDTIDANEPYPSFDFFSEWLPLDIFHFLLNLFLTSSVIFVIIKFSTYTLSTKLFKIQSIVAVVLSGICTVMFLAVENFYPAPLSGMVLLASIAICGRVCVLKKRVKRGEAAEMKRRTTELDGEEVKLEDGNKFWAVEREGVEFEDGNKFRGVESEVAIMSVAHHVPRPL